jgi:hypothetical protein
MTLLLTSKTADRRSGALGHPDRADDLAIRPPADDRRLPQLGCPDVPSRVDADPVESPRHAPVPPRLEGRQREEALVAGKTGRSIVVVLVYPENHRIDVV